MIINPPLLVSTNHQYFSRLLDWKDMQYEKVGRLHRVTGFNDYNRLIDINKVFSTSPNGEIVDRTLSITGPMNFKVIRPWPGTKTNFDLESVFESRVKQYTSQDRQIDLFWSGGADSTALVVAFLNHQTNLDQLRLVYSPYSIYENRNFFEFITKKFPHLKTVDISGNVYLDSNFNNIIVTGHGGDEFTASIDLSFFENVGSAGLEQKWKDFFFNATGDSKLIDFCEEYFAKANRPIDTVLEARWWFYAATKSQVYAPREMSFLFNQQNLSLSNISAFFDCQEFEDYMWHNTDKIITAGGDYRTYKKFLRQYIHKLFQDTDYLENTAKMDSRQLQLYRYKKIELLDLHWICLLEDSSVIRTKNLPLLSKKEFDDKYGNTLDYLFNTPG